MRKIQKNSPKLRMLETRLIVIENDLQSYLTHLVLHENDYPDLIITDKLVDSVQCYRNLIANLREELNNYKYGKKCNY